MKRMSICLIAAVAVLTLAAMPAMACNQHNSHKAYKAEGTIDSWEVCYYQGAADGSAPVGPASFFMKDEPVKGDVLVHFTGEMAFNAKDKNGKVTWHRHTHGTAVVYPNTTGGSVASSVAAARSAAPMAIVQTPVGPQSMYLYACDPVPAPIETPSEQPLYNGPFQIEELVKDMGNGFACYDPHNPTPVSFYECLQKEGTTWAEVDYMMYHLKFSGHRVYWWKTLVPELGKLCYEEKGGYEYCSQ